MNGAFAYKRVSEYDKAIAMYGALHRSVRQPEELDALRNGDPKATRRSTPTKKYEEHVEFLKGA
jgi:hypothetical protein